jgi:hypothetical protein
MNNVKQGPYWTTPSRRRQVGKLSTWAEDGLLFWEWQEEGSSDKQGDVGVKELPDARAWRASMIRDLAIWDKKREGAPTAKDRAYAIEYYHTLKAHLEAIDDTIKEAEAQGDQSNPEVRRRKLMAFLRMKREGSGISMPSEAATALLFPGMNGQTMVFGPDSPHVRSRPIAVEAPEIHPNWLKFRGS